jgi:hypothetical protein
MEAISDQLRFAYATLFLGAGESYFEATILDALQQSAVQWIEFSGVDENGRAHVKARYVLDRTTRLRYEKMEFVTPPCWEAGIAPEVKVATAFFERHVALKKLTRQAYWGLREGSTFRGFSQPKLRRPRLHKEWVGHWSRIPELKELRVGFMIAHHDAGSLTKVR